MPSIVPFFRWNALLAARREKGNRYVHIVTRFFNIHHTIASKAYVARLVSPSTAKPPHRFDAGRQQLSIGACRRGRCSLYSRIHRSKSACNSSIEHLFAEGDAVEHGLVEALVELLVLVRE